VGYTKETAVVTRLAQYTCGVRFPVDPKYSAPLDNKQVERLYEFYVEDLIPCIEDLGLVVPAIPTFQVFVEAQAGDAAWNPVQQAVGSDPEKYAQVYASCETFPASAYE